MKIKYASGGAINASKPEINSDPSKVNCQNLTRSRLDQ